jgi:hypothetical protein
LAVGAEAPSLLAGLIGDADGKHLSPTHAVKKGKRYWTCLEKVESFPWMKGELDDEAEGIYARV